jgi:Tfp pilus assembly ATPase PilU
MTDKPAPTPLLAPLVLPPNCRDVTAEKVGTLVVIVGATGGGRFFRSISAAFERVDDANERSATGDQETSW